MNIQFIIWLNMISAVSILLPLGVGFYARRKDLALFLFYLLAMTVVQGIMIYLATKGNNLIMLHVGIIIEYVLLSIVLVRWISSDDLKKVAGFMAFFMGLIIVPTAMLTPLHKECPDVMAIEALALTGLSVCVLVVEDLGRGRKFIATGMLIFFSVNAMMYVFRTGIFIEALYIVLPIVNIVSYCYFIIGFLCKE